MRIFLLALSLVTCAASGPTQAAGTTSQDIRLSVRIAPKAVKSAGRYHVVYELHVDNQQDSAIRPTALRLYPKTPSALPALQYQGDKLRSSLEIFDKNYRATGRSDGLIGPGQTGVFFVWLTRDTAEREASAWTHQFDFERADEARTISISGGDFSIVAGSPLRISPPLAGGPWWRMESMHNEAVHRRAMVLDQPFISQRYGVDYIMLGETGLPISAADRTNIDLWYGYGQPVLAVANGIVTDLVTGLPDNVPTRPERAVPMTIDSFNGNSIILDIGNGHYAVYGHLAPDSITVQLGQRVRRGQVLGRLGNSGNSQGPHLHFHLGTANQVFDAEGLPYVYRKFIDLGTTTLAELEAGGFHSEGKARDRRRNEIPRANAVVVYPKAP